MYKHATSITTQVRAATAYPFQYSDGGRADGSYRNEAADCTVRALAIATGTPYDVAYQELRKRGRRCGKGFNFPRHGQNDQALGYLFYWIALPDVGGRWMTPTSFTRLYTKGVYICTVSQHVFVSARGVVYDMEPEREHRWIRGCWKVVADG